jgi:hypothetical protein
MKTGAPPMRPAPDARRCQHVPHDELNAAAKWTLFCCPRTCTCQMATVRSKLAVASCLPLGDQEQERTVRVCISSSTALQRHWLVVASHIQILTVLSPLQLASMSPAHARTALSWRAASGRRQQGRGGAAQGAGHDAPQSTAPDGDHVTLHTLSSCPDSICSSSSSPVSLVIAI